MFLERKVLSIPNIEYLPFVICHSSISLSCWLSLPLDWHHRPRGPDEGVVCSSGDASGPRGLQHTHSAGERWQRVNRDTLIITFELCISYWSGKIEGKRKRKSETFKVAIIMHFYLATMYNPKIMKIAISTKGGKGEHSEGLPVSCLFVG